jgi:hypothetical protein
LTEHVFWRDPRAMRGDDPEPPPRRVQLHEIEGLRRSVAISNHLSRSELERCLDTLADLLVERVRIERILADLGPAWGGAKKALNELHRVVRGER